MALGICYETAIRLFFVLVKKACENWFYTIVLVILFYYGFFKFLGGLISPKILGFIILGIIILFALGITFSTYFCDTLNSFLIYIQ